MTHDMIKALSSEERAFFVDNMIGDLLQIGRPGGLGADQSSLSSALGEDTNAITKHG